MKKTINLTAIEFQDSLFEPARPHNVQKQVADAVYKNSMTVDALDLALRLFNAPDGPVEVSEADLNIIRSAVPVAFFEFAKAPILKALE